MAGIKHLEEIYKQRGRDFVDNLFDRHVIVNEKMDGSSFMMERDLATGEMKFFKRNADVPISMVDRTLMRLYEKPIQHFKSLSKETLNKIPKGWRFGMEYFTDEKPQEISYDRVPKNNLILSYIHVKNGKGDLVRTIQDEEELDKWADILDIERPPIIFSGMLKPEQKIKILDFIDTPHDQLSEKFKTESFVKFVISVLNPKMKKTTLNNDLNKSIEGLVFRFGDEDDGDVTLAKMVDPLFELMAKTRTKEKVTDGNDIYNLTVIDVMNYIESLNLRKYKPKGKTYDERYLNFINAVFNTFIDEFGDKYKDLDFQEPEYLKKKAFDVNTDLIDNKETAMRIEENPAYKNLYKIMLASFRKRKRRPNGIFTEDVVRQFNSTIEKIHDHLAVGLMESEETPTFSDFMSAYAPAVDNDEETVTDDNSDVADLHDKIDKSIKGNHEEPEVTMPEPKKDEDGQELDEPEPEVITDPATNKVNIVVGRFQPFHNGHMQIAKDLFKENGRQVVLVAVEPGNNNSGQSPYTPGTIASILSNIGADSDGAIKDFVMIKRGFISDVVTALREKGYEPVLWGAGQDRIDGYRKQMEFNAKNDNELNIGADTKLVKTNRYGSGTDVRKAVTDDKFNKFKSLVPKSVQGMWTVLRKDDERARAEAEAARKAEEKEKA